jgi:hypothetical protein
MGKMPDVRGPDRPKPITIDPKTGRFITIDDIETRGVVPVPLDALSHDQLVRLVIERNRLGPDYTVQSISGPPLSRDQVMREIEAGTEFGRMAVQAELMALSELLDKIRAALDEKSSQGGPEI